MTQPSTGVRVPPQWTQADRLRKAREHAGLTQGELAAEIGVSQRSISNYEGGVTAKRPVLLSWALRCDVSLDWLKKGYEIRDPDPHTPLADTRCTEPKGTVLSLPRQQTLTAQYLQCAA